ncbi:MAG TPA: hypothetical protein VN963_03515 [bacterium]|nr:hypothetical protein [bacterium]
MKLFALLFLILSALLGKAWSYGMPPISVGEDSELLTDTPIPIPHYRAATPTMTATPLPTLTFTPQPTPQQPQAPTAIPTLVETVAPSPSPTLEPRGLNTFREQGFFDVGLGLDPSVQGSTLPGTASGAEAAAGILFKDGLAVQLDFEYFSYSNSNSDGTLSEGEVLVLPTLRRYLTAGSVRPYLSIGNGLAINTATSGYTHSSMDSFDLALGGGIEFLLDHYFSTYVEGKYNFVFMSGSPNQDIPVVIGARLGL